jgi:hypothetical protein
VTVWRAAFGAAVVVALLVGHALRDTPGYMVRNPDGSLTGDITHYVYWTRLVTLGGIQSAYDGKWPETYAVYPPVTLYSYEALGIAYRSFEDPSFEPDRAQQSLWLHEGIKLVALVWHVATAIGVFVLVRRMTSEKLAAISASLYVVDPAALYDVAHWAQPDGAHSLFSVLAVGLLSLGQIAAGWAMFAVAALAKPQAWSIAALLGISTLRSNGPGGLVRGLISGALAGIIVCLPFLVTGHLNDLLTLPGVIGSVMPVVSADAHNLWWLVLQLRGQDPLFLDDSARALGPLTYRMLAAGLVGVSLLLVAWLYWTRRARLAEAAAMSVLGWFTFTTQAHENHLFFALPLLALAWPTRRGLLVPFGIISLTLLLNMLLHDQLVLAAMGYSVQDRLIVRLRLVNAALNLACCIGWYLLAVLRTRSRSRVRDRAAAMPRTVPVA